MEQLKQEVCQIRIMFPVESDEQAMDYKKQINAILKDRPDAIVSFSINNNPLSYPPKQ